MYKENFNSLKIDEEGRRKIRNAIETLSSYHIFNYLREVADEILEIEAANPSLHMIAGAKHLGYVKCIKALELLIDPVIEINPSKLKSTYKREK